MQEFFFTWLEMIAQAVKRLWFTADNLNAFLLLFLPGGGERISCLRNVHEDPNMRLESRCEKLLLTRLEMFAQAVEVMPVKSIQDLYVTVSKSPHKTYFLLVGCLMLAGIFLFGLLCGRVSKRSREMKMKWGNQSHLKSQIPKLDILTQGEKWKKQRKKTWTYFKRKQEDKEEISDAF